MKRIRFKFLIFAFCLGLLLLSSCSAFAPVPKSQKNVIARPIQGNQQKAKIDYSKVQESSYRRRQAIPLEQGRYEGSLWNTEASWGNLMIDHRARFRNDVLTISNLQKIMDVSDDPDEKEAESKTERNLNAIGDALGLYDHKKEQNGVLRKINTLSAKVERVLPNGNLVVVAKKIDYRRDNQIRYITTVRGLIRQQDINAENTIDAEKLAFSEVKIRRQVLQRSLDLQKLAPIIGGKRAGILSSGSRLLSNPNGTTSLNTR